MAPRKAGPSDFFQSIRVTAPQGSGSRFLADAEDEDESMSEAEEPATDPDPLHAIISLQSSDGSWLLKSLLDILGLADNERAKSPWGMRNNEPQDEKIWATILAIRYFMDKLAHEKEAWELLVKKAEGWLDGVCDNGAHLRTQWDGIALHLIDEM